MLLGQTNNKLFEEWNRRAISVRPGVTDVMKGLLSSTKSARLKYG